MLYHYVAADKSGRVLEGDLDAASVQEALQHLAGEGLQPISVKPVQVARLGARRLLGGIKLRDKIFLTKYLSLMLRVGTDLLSAINILIVDFDNPAMKNFLLEVRDNLVAGRPFYEAFARYPKVFSPVFVNLVRAAEASGNLQKTFEDLSESLTAEAELRGKVRSALVYPVILLVVSVGIVIFISTFALPKIAETFSQGGIEPPLFSKIVFAVGLFINAHAGVIIGTLLVLALAGGYFFFMNEYGRRFGARLLGRLPVIRKVRRDLAIERFAATLASLMRAGLPIVEAITITAETVGSDELRDALRRVSQEGLAKGLTVGEAFRREPAFPQVVTNLVAISEKAGHIEEVLQTLANFYAINITNTIRAAVAFLEPILLAGMGVLVAILALAIILPVYQLATQF
jgi:type IV pilus assembly protein PilC